MLIEHLLYSTAIAIFIGMFFFRYTGRDSSWIIIFMSFIPDLDFIATILRNFGVTVFFEGNAVYHGMFHTVAALVIMGVIFACIFNTFGVRFFDALFFSSIGYGAHLFEDALVYPRGYAFLWPLSHHYMGLGWLTPAFNEESYNASADFFHIANTEVLLIGVGLLMIVILIRTRVEGTGWIRWYLPEKIYRYYFS
jgi:hypothetical protein